MSGNMAYTVFDLLSLECGGEKEERRRRKAESKEEEKNIM